MSIQSQAESLDALMSQFEADVDRINTNRTLSQEGRIERLESMRGDVISRATALVGTLWDLDTGAVWSQIDAADRALADARSDASGPVGDPVHNLARARAILAGLTSAGEFMTAYERASTHEKCALQDYASAELERLSPREANEVAHFLARERQARITNGAVRVAQRRVDDVIAQVDAAYRSTNRANRLLAPWTDEIRHALQTVRRVERYIPPSVDFPNGAMTLEFTKAKPALIIGTSTFISEGK